MAKQKIKPTSIRISENLLEDIDQKCEGLGCSRNDYITSVLEESTNETQVQKPKEEPRYKVILNADMPKGQVTKVSYDDGKTWIDFNNKL